MPILRIRENDPDPGSWETTVGEFLEKIGKRRREGIPFDNLFLRVLRPVPVE